MLPIGTSCTSSIWCPWILVTILDGQDIFQWIIRTCTISLYWLLYEFPVLHNRLIEQWACCNQIKNTITGCPTCPKLLLLVVLFWFWTALLQGCHCCIHYTTSRQVDNLKSRNIHIFNNLPFRSVSPSVVIPEIFIS